MSYSPIENYGIIGNVRMVALVRINGSIDWYCYPQFDSPSIFGAILDDKKGVDSKFPLAVTVSGTNRSMAFQQRLGYALLLGGWNRRAGKLHAGGFTLRQARASSYLSPHTLCEGYCAHFGLLPSGFNRAARRGPGQFPAGVYTPSTNQRRIQCRPNVGQPSLNNASLSVKDRGGIHAGSQTRMRARKEYRRDNASRCSGSIRSNGRLSP